MKLQNNSFLVCIQTVSKNTHRLLILFVILLVFYMPTFLWSAPNIYELAIIKEQIRKDFDHMLQLWKEELYFELYEIGQIETQEKLASFILTEQSFKDLEQRGLPKTIRTKLKQLENRLFKNTNSFLKELKKIIGKQETVKYRESILKHAKKLEESVVFAQKMIETQWRPSSDPIKIKIKDIKVFYRTMAVIECNFTYENKTNPEKTIEKEEKFVIIKHNGQWRFNLWHFIRAPFQ